MLAGLVQGSGCLRFLSRDDKTLSNAESTLVTGRVTRGVVTRKVRASTPIFVWHKTPKDHKHEKWTPMPHFSVCQEKGRQVGDRGDRGMWGSVTWEHLTPCLGQTWDQGGCFVGDQEYKWLAWDTQQLRHTDKDPPTQTLMTQTNLWQSS